MKSDPFCVDDKKEERDFVELSKSFYVYMSLFTRSFMWTCSVWCLDIRFYIVVLILWFGTCFEVGMSLCMEKFRL